LGVVETRQIVGLRKFTLRDAHRGED